MATFTDAGKLANHQRNRQAQRKQSLLTSTKSAAELARTVAIDLTSGTVSAATLRQLRPFARDAKRRRGTLPTTPINAHTGGVRSGWRIFATGGVRSGWRLQNMNAHAKYVLRPGGTRYMIDRKFWQRLREETYTRILAMYEQALTAP